MKTKKIKLCEVSSTVLFIGFEGEQNYRRVEIDATEVFAEMPDAVPSMAIKPPVGDVYPKALERDGNTIVWEISASDCATVGDGAYQLTFIDGESIGKEFKGYFKVFDALVGSGEAPEPIEDFVEFANAVLAALQNMTASAETIPASEPATAEITQIGGHKNLALGIPAGEPGIDGVSPTISITDITGGHRLTITDKTGTRSVDVMDGEDGQDGISPVITVTQITGGHRVTITDATGAKSFDVLNGAKGDPGTDGISPTATVTKSGGTATITITDKNGTTTAQVSDGNPETIIDDNAGAGVTNKTFSANKLTGEFTDLKSQIQSKIDEPSTEGTDGQVLATDGDGGRYWKTVSGGGGGTSDYTDLTNKPQINSVTLSGNKSLSDLGIASASDLAAKYEKPSGGIPASDLASGVIPSVPVTDIQSGGVSIVNNGVAEINPVDNVSGTTPSITGVANTRYICGECSTLSITAPASGCIDVTFTSGSTPTVLTVTSAKANTTIKWANGFDPSSLDANTTYEVNILDGEFGVVGSWT